MDRFKLLFILALGGHFYQINGLRQFPIRGLFTTRSEDKTREVFTKFAHDSKRSYYGTEKVSRSFDGFSVSLEMCEDGAGASAIIDARPTKGICDNVCLLSSKLNIPHLTLDWEPVERMPKESFTFFYHPSPEAISKVYANFIKKMDWERFSILYEDERSFIRLQEVINSWENDKIPIVFKKIIPGGDNRETFKYIFKVARLSYHIIDCKAEHILHYLDEITKVENYTEYQNILLTSLDAYKLDLNNTAIEGNITTWHLTEGSDYQWNDIGISSPKAIETHLAADALNHLDKSIRYMLETMDIGNQRNMPDPPALCYNEDTKLWEIGRHLREALQKTTIKGFTGNIQFDENGKREDFLLHYSKLNNIDSKFVYSGHWNSTTDTIYDLNTNTEQSIKQKIHFRIVTKDNNKPYYIPPKNADEKPTGYIVDLMNATFDHMRNVQKLGDYSYNIDTCPGGVGDRIEGSRRWTGMMGELIEHKAQFAVADLTITSERNAVVDFSIPIMNLGICMLFKADPPSDPDMFSFINPLSTAVWLYLAVVYILTSLVLLICARMSQADWVNPHPCERNPTNLENIWSLYNCMWLTMGSIMTQGCDILPRGAGSRWITGTWWFFAMIVTASYTANMSTFMSNNRRSNDIRDVNALSEQTAISYGAVINGSTYKFFEKSNDPTNQKIFQTMTSANPTVFTRDNNEGVRRVQRSKGKFVFFMESSSIEYFLKQDCNLKMVGGKLDNKDYGIAMPKKSPYRMYINRAVLFLQESGTLASLKKKWWVKDPDEPPAEGECQDEESKESDESGSVLMKNTSGIFLVLGMGGILGFIVAIIGFFLHSHEIAVKEGISYKEALASEWRASLDPRVLIKPTAPPRSVANSTKSASPQERSRSRAASVLQSFINLNEVY